MDTITSIDRNLLMTRYIPDATFNKESELQIEFQLTTIHKLYKRNLDHSLEKPHRLGFNAIIFITKGKGVHTVDFVPYSYTKGSVLFIAKEQVHSFKINPNSDGYILAFTDNFLNRLVVNNELNILHEIFDYIYHPVKVQLEDKLYEDVVKLFEVIDTDVATLIHTKNI